MKQKIEQLLEKMRPALQADGGDIELVEVDEKNKAVKIKFKGACAGCPFSQMTLKNFVESSIRKEIPEVESVEAV